MQQSRKHTISLKNIIICKNLAIYKGTIIGKLQYCANDMALLINLKPGQYVQERGPSIW